LNAADAGEFGGLVNFSWLRIDENPDCASFSWEHVQDSTNGGWHNVARTFSIKVKPNHVCAEFNARARIIRTCNTADFDLCRCHLGKMTTPEICRAFESLAGRFRDPLQL